MDGGQLSEGADIVRAGPGVDLVAGRERPHRRAHPHDPARQVVAEHEGHPVGQDPLELAVPDLGVQEVDARRPHRHQDVMLADTGLGHLPHLHAVLAAVPAHCERLHHASSLSSRQRAAGRVAGILDSLDQLNYDRTTIG
jgi:hypothetical protein